MFEQQISRGVALLDQHIGLDWREKIDPIILDMRECEVCIIGQLFISYRRGLHTLGIEPITEDVIQYGFGLDGDVLEYNHPDWDILTDEWRTECLKPKLLKV